MYPVSSNRDIISLSQYACDHINRLYTYSKYATDDTDTLKQLIATMYNLRMNIYSNANKIKVIYIQELYISKNKQIPIYRENFDFFCTRLIIYYYMINPPIAEIGFLPSLNPSDHMNNALYTNTSWEIIDVDDIYEISFDEVLRVNPSTTIIPSVEEKLHITRQTVITALTEE